MDCLICFKIFIKETEFKNISPPKSNICVRSICKLLEVPKSPRIQEIFQDPVICSKCYQKLENANQKFAQLEELQSKIEEIRGEVIKDLKNSKNMSQVMKNVYGEISRSSQRREQLFKAIKGQSDANRNITQIVSDDQDESSEESIAFDEFQESSKKDESSINEINLEMRINKKRRLEMLKNWTEITPKSSKNSQNSDKICKEIRIFPSKFTSFNQENHSERPKKGLICSECEKPHNSKSELEAHMEDALNSNQIKKCSKCAEEFWGSQCLEYHISIHDNHSDISNSKVENQKQSKANLNSKICKLNPSCKRSFKYQGSLKFKCSFKGCDKKYHRKDSLKRHFLLHNNLGQFKCIKCSKKFSNKWNLNRHKLSHSGHMPYKCQYCSRKFIRKRKLIVHIGDGISEYCGICKEQFKSNGCLRHHNSISHGMSYYSSSKSTERRDLIQCKTCKKYFRSKNLKQHELTHGEPKFKCTEIGCEKLFKRLANVREHIKIVHKRIKYICKFDGCDKEFSRKFDLNNHTKIVHKMI